jgi:hypothetical protein
VHCYFDSESTSIHHSTYNEYCNPVISPQSLSSLHLESGDTAQTVPRGDPFAFAVRPGSLHSINQSPLNSTMQHERLTATKETISSVSSNQPVTNITKSVLTPYTDLDAIHAINKRSSAQASSHAPPASQMIGPPPASTLAKSAESPSPKATCVRLRRTASVCGLESDLSPACRPQIVTASRLRRIAAAAARMSCVCLVRRPTCSTPCLTIERGTRLSSLSSRVTSRRL